MSLQVHGRKPQVHVEVIFLLERSDSAKFASLRQGEKLHVATPSPVPLQKEPLECGRRHCLSRQLLWKPSFLLLEELCIGYVFPCIRLTTLLVVWGPLPLQRGSSYWSVKAFHSPDSVLFEQLGCLPHGFTPLFCLQLLFTKSCMLVFLFLFAQPSGLSCFFRVIGPMTACRLMTSTSIFTTCFFFLPLEWFLKPYDSCCAWVWCK